MFTEFILPGLTAIGTASVAWHLARAQKQTESLAGMAKLKLALERQKQRNRLLSAQLQLVNAKLQFEVTQRSVELAALKVCLPEHLQARLEESHFLAPKTFDTTCLDAGLDALKGRKRIAGSRARSA